MRNRACRATQCLQRASGFVSVASVQACAYRQRSTPLPSTSATAAHAPRAPRRGSATTRSHRRSTAALAVAVVALMHARHACSRARRAAIADSFCAYKIFAFWQAAMAVSQMPTAHSYRWTPRSRESSKSLRSGVYSDVYCCYYTPPAYYTPPRTLYSCKKKVYCCYYTHVPYNTGNNTPV